MKVVSVINYKGGVGKTTLTANLGAYAASRGLRVLLIDLDPQTNLTFSFVTYEQWHEYIADSATLLNFFSAIHENKKIPDLSSLIISRNLGKTKIDLISSHLKLINVDVKLSTKLIGSDSISLAANNVETVSYLRKAIFKLQGLYDLVLMDCPPNFYVIVKNALTASDYYLVPTKLDYFSTLGTDYIINQATEYTQEFNSRVRSLGNDENRPIYLDLLGVVPMMVSVPREDTLQKAQQVFYDFLREKHYPMFQWIRNNNEMFGTESKDTQGNRVPAIVAHMKADTSKLRARAEVQQLCNEILSRLKLQI